MFCPNCGSEVKEDSDFCGTCGTRCFADVKEAIEDVDAKKSENETDTSKSIVKEILELIFEVVKEWLKKSGEEKINDIFGFINAIVLLIIILKYHSAIIVAWKLAWKVSGVGAFLVDCLGFILILGSIISIVQSVVKAIYFAAKQKIGKLFQMIFEFFYSIIICVFSFRVFLNTKGELILLAVAIIVGGIEYAICSLLIKNKDE